MRALSHADSITWRLSHVDSITLRIQPESLKQKDSSPGEYAPLMEDRKRWMTSQNYRTRTAAPQMFNIILQDSLSLGWHDWHLGLAKSQLWSLSCLLFGNARVFGCQLNPPQGTKLPPDNNSSLQVGMLEQSAKTKFRTLVSMYLCTCSPRSVAWEKLTRGPLNLKVIFFYL